MVKTANAENNGMSRNYRAYVGNPKEYDRLGAVQFAVLTMLGLRETHYLLDIGCGPLRGGRLFIPYLLPGHYCGMDMAMAKGMVEQGLRNELGEGIIKVKRPRFAYRADFEFGGFTQAFDYVLAQAVFSHITMDEIRKCLRQAEAVMKPQAILVASFHEGGNGAHPRRLVYPEVAWYRMEDIRNAAAKVGLTCRRVNQVLLGGTNLHEQYARSSWVVMERG